MKKTLLLVVSIALVTAVAIIGTFSYLTSTSQDKNTFTVGNVTIDQIEQERGENGELADFEQDKPLIPAVGEIAWDDEKLVIGDKEYSVFDDELQNVQDKIVTVANTGKNDAYFRTWIAFENNEGAAGYIHHSYNNKDYTWSAFADDYSWNMVVDENGVEYWLLVATYNEALPAGETSPASLLQVFLDSTADNSFFEAIGEQYDILVFTEAVQAGGFPDAETALNEAFGVPTEGYNPWGYSLITNP